MCFWGKVNYQIVILKFVRFRLYLVLYSVLYRSKFQFVGEGLSSELALSNNENNKFKVC